MVMLNDYLKSRSQVSIMGFVVAPSVSVGGVQSEGRRCPKRGAGCPKCALGKATVSRLRDAKCLLKLKTVVLDWSLKLGNAGTKNCMPVLSKLAV